MTTSDPALTERYPYLASLNAAQLEAVTAPPDVPLQILAGPGSGKTRVLTCRVAHLVKRHGIQPVEITAVTFTNKAANEMRKRLNVLLGEKQAEQLVLGTFHATCARFLRRYGKWIDLDPSFTIADQDDCKKIMKRLLKERKEELANQRLELKEGDVLSSISKAKAKEQSPEDMLELATSKPDADMQVLELVIAQLYAEYDAALREANALDFDDLLLFGLRLFRAHPNVIASCRHILVDEFQDTNTIQYELMRCFAHTGVSIVGDPDQSIYGWRSAEIENLNKMTEDFKGTRAIHLEENYRSTGAILSASHAVVTQDPKRIPKSLFTSHPTSTTVSLKTFVSPTLEAGYISAEIKRLVAYTGGMLDFNDFAILLRYNALSRVIEAELQKSGIPCRVIGGHKFFERMEIKDLLAYLQLADNPNFNPAFLRVVNVPKRAIGDKSVAELVLAAKKAGKSMMELAESIVDGDNVVSVKTALKKNLATFVGVVRKLRRAALKGTSVADLIRLTIEKTKYEDYLRQQPDFDQRWENVQELINFSVSLAEEQERQALSGGEAVEADVGFQSAREVKPSVTRRDSEKSNGTHAESYRMFKNNKPKRPTRKASATKESNGVIELLDSDEESLDESSLSPNPPDIPEELTPLRFFLQSSMLSTDTEVEDEEGNKPKVTISTVHSAKGLEWPVVFIPAMEDSTFPSYRCVEDHEIAEERRLLYVAMTRAQVFLTLTHCQARMSGGEVNNRVLSPFMLKVLKTQPDVLTSSMPEITEEVRQVAATITGRSLPDESVTRDLIAKYVRTAPPPSTWDEPDPESRFYNRFGRRDGPGKMTRGLEYWNSDFDDYALPGEGGSPSYNMGVPKGFTSISSAKSLLRQAKAPPAPKPPPVKLKSSNYGLPGPIPFTFAEEREQKPADLTSFTSSSNAGLAAMKSLGLGLGGDSPSSGGGSPVGLSSFTSSSNAGLAAMKSLGSDLGGDAAANVEVKPATGSVPLARGTKRLGMGRAPSSWGAKKAKK